MPRCTVVLAAWPGARATGCNCRPSASARAPGWAASCCCRWPGGPMPSSPGCRSSAACTTMVLPRANGGAWACRSSLTVCGARCQPLAMQAAVSTPADIQTHHRVTHPRHRRRLRPIHPLRRLHLRRHPRLRPLPCPSQCRIHFRTQTRRRKFDQCPGAGVVRSNKQCLLKRRVRLARDDDPRFGSAVQSEHVPPVIA